MKLPEIFFGITVIMRVTKVQRVYKLYTFIVFGVFGLEILFQVIVLRLCKDTSLLFFLI